MFGTQAPSRLVLQDRAASDPNLIRHTPPEDQVTKEGYSADMEDNEEDGAVSQNDNELLSLLEQQAASNLPPEKVMNVASYVASLEVPSQCEEEGEDQGIQMVTTSESASLYSSPPLTPPDDEDLAAQVIAALTDRRQPVSNSETTGTEVHMSLEAAESMDRQPVALTVPLHAKATRAASLPSSLFPSPKGSGQSPPKLALEETDSSIPEGPIKVTQIQSVPERIKEIEKLNRISVSRPHSAGSSTTRKTPKKDRDSDSPDRFSSDESIPTCESSQPSPCPPCHKGGPLISAEQSPAPVSFPEAVDIPRRSSMEPTTVKPNKDDLLSSFLTADDLAADPSKSYKHAADKHESFFRRVPDSGSQPNISACGEDTSTKKVKDLTSMFGGSSLRRSSSLRQFGTSVPSSNNSSRKSLPS